MIDPMFADLVYAICCYCFWRASIRVLGRMLLTGTRFLRAAMSALVVRYSWPLHGKSILIVPIP